MSVTCQRARHSDVTCLFTGVNVIKVLHLYFTRVAIVSLAENNSCTCKLQV